MTVIHLLQAFSGAVSRAVLQ